MKRFLREWWPLVLIAVAGAFWFWALSVSMDDVKEYTRKCNVEGGIALNADAPSKRQCIKAVQSIIIN